MPIPNITQPSKPTNNIVQDSIWLIEAILIAISFHVLMVPVIWIMGFVLPFPHPQPRLTSYEINLKNFKVDVKTIKTTEIVK